MTISVAPNAIFLHYHASMETRRIVIDARWVLPAPTGIGRYITSLLPPLLRLVPDWQFHILRRHNPWPGFRLDSLSAPNLVHHVTTIPCLSVRQYSAIPDLVRKLNAALLHHPHFDAPVLWQSVPVIATLHDVKYLLHPEFFPHGSTLLRRVIMKMIFSLTLRRAAAVITVSRNTATEIKQLFGKRTGGLTVIREAAESAFSRSTPDEISTWRRRYNISKPFILTVGERRPHKNLVSLIRAFAASSVAGTYDLVIAGKPCQGYDLPEHTVQQLGLKSKVHFLDSVTDAELSSAYSAAQIFAFVSLHEGFGLPLLEAMACGVPVIAASTTAAGEVAGNAALKVDPAQECAITAAIDTLSHDEILRNRLIAGGLIRCREFTWERAASETVAVYRQCIERHNS